MADFQSSLGPLGEPLSLRQTSEELRGGMTFRTFDIVYPGRRLRLTTYTYPDGKLEQYLICAHRLVLRTRTFGVDADNNSGVISGCGLTGRPLRSRCNAPVASFGPMTGSFAPSQPGRSKAPKFTRVAPFHP